MPAERDLPTFRSQSGVQPQFRVVPLCEYLFTQKGASDTWITRFRGRLSLPHEVGEHIFDGVQSFAFVDEDPTSDYVRLIIYEKFNEIHGAHRKGDSYRMTPPVLFPRQVANQILRQFELPDLVQKTISTQHFVAIRPDSISVVSNPENSPTESLAPDSTQIFQRHLYDSPEELIRRGMERRSKSGKTSRSRLIFSTETRTSVLPDELPVRITEREVVGSSDEMRRHNIAAMVANVLRLQRLRPLRLAYMSPLDQVIVTFQEMLRGHLIRDGGPLSVIQIPERGSFSSDAEYGEAVASAARARIDLNALLAQRGLRSVDPERAGRVLFMNFLAPHGRHVGKLLEIWADKVDQLIREISSEQDALRVAAWAKRMITEIQPGEDANSRVGRETYENILASIGHLRPSYRVRYSQGGKGIDLYHKSFMAISVRNKMREREYEFHPFVSESYKQHLNRLLMTDLEAYCARTWNKAVFVVRPELEEDGSAAPMPVSPVLKVVSIGAASGPAETVAYEEKVLPGELRHLPTIVALTQEDQAHHFETVNSFFLERLTRDSEGRPLDMDSLRRDPLLTQEVDQIIEILTQGSILPPSPPSESSRLEVPTMDAAQE